MRNLSACVTLVAVISGCASSRTVPVAYSATMPVDFSEIPADRCSPPLDGLYLSYEGANDLIRAYRKQDTACEMAKIDLTQRAEIAEVRCKECETAKQWSIWAPVIGFILGAATSAAIVIGVMK